ncbi:sarcosine oxidase subunit gamma [Dinoroseobacter sp. S76]|uniref:sarcosine oxidase subunit gamma n=1 Tax=Dinoroseobacter sp. S76 TaxID=3415124 RepID=UPI003C7E1B0D
MSETSITLQPRTALGGLTPRVDTIGTLTLTENPGFALASLSARVGQEETCHAALTALLGAVPGPGEMTRGTPETGFWIGPEAWMITAPFDTREDLAAVLKTRFRAAASITEQTDGWVVFDLAGDMIAAAMELLCPVEIRRMPPGAAQRTVIDHLGCFVLRPETGDLIRILGPRSSAGSLHHALLTGMEAVA